MSLKGMVLFLFWCKIFCFSLSVNASEPTSDFKIDVLPLKALARNVLSDLPSKKVPKESVLSQLELSHFHQIPGLFFPNMIRVLRMSMRDQNQIRSRLKNLFLNILRSGDMHPFDVSWEIFKDPKFCKSKFIQDIFREIARELVEENLKTNSQNPNLNYSYALMLWSGLGVKKNHRTARRVLERNVKIHNHPKSKYFLTYMKSKGLGGEEISDEEARKKFLEIWNDHHLDIAGNLALFQCLYEFEGETKFKIAKLLAETHNIPRAFLPYGNNLREGNGCIANPVLARKIYLYDWKLNRCASSALWLTEMLDKGHGGPKDQKLMRQLLNLIFENWDDPIARNDYAITLQYGHGGEKNLSQAKKLLRKCWDEEPDNKRLIENYMRILKEAPEGQKDLDEIKMLNELLAAIKSGV